METGGLMRTEEYTQSHAHSSSGCKSGFHNLLMEKDGLMCTEEYTQCHIHSSSDYQYGLYKPLTEKHWIPWFEESISIIYFVASVSLNGTPPIIL
ncbi:hypothetical protein AVEN_210552-1 [Araneus ventricosus]|uniref:Uncharacterized protein n=1 Tax=Araneus ventricosus TaxID=182803 RepID=A0A4Y2FR43_ARAVE|nr:hypothetical protein AVEN_210552-1 [Araneus ventricosus]